MATQPIRFPSTDVAQASVRRLALPVGANRNRSGRHSSPVLPVPHSVMWGTADKPDETLCPSCLEEHWKCRCHGGEGVVPSPL